MDRPVPVELNHMRAEEKVRITWGDGHQGDYPQDYLRGYCPCAMCQGHDSKIERKSVSPAEAKLREISVVGNYAIEFRWEDGHSTGIYTFDYLRSLCPCAECNAGRD